MTLKSISLFILYYNLFELHTIESLSRYAFNMEQWNHPVPLDICLQMQENKYIAYSCDTTTSPQQLIESNYANDASCSSNPIVSYHTNNTSTYSFNCIGENNYIILNDCSNSISSYIPTDICYANTQYSCNAYYSFISSCNDVPTTYISSTICNNDNTIMANCVQNSSSISNSSSIELKFMYDLYFSVTNYSSITNPSFDFNTSLNALINENSIDLINIELYNGLPSSICELQYVKKISIIYDDNIVMNTTWIMPECIYTSLLFLEELTLINTNIYGNISKMVPLNIKILHLHNNPFILGTLPSNMCNLTTLYLVHMIGINGIIPECIFCNEYLELLDIRYMDNIVAQAVPLCFSDSKPFLETLIISNTLFQSELPPLPLSNKLNIINLGYNNFDGDLMNIFANYINNSDIIIYNDLWCILLNNNNFNTDKLFDILQFIYNEWPFIELFSISNNPAITGSIPFIQSKINKTHSDNNILHSSKQIFVAHNCDISGALPSHLIMSYNLEWFTLFNNRISGSIPNNIGIDINTNQSFIPLILLGNRLYPSSGDILPEWMNSSPFSSQTNLYGVTFQLIVSIILLFISGIGVKINIISLVKHFRNRLEKEEVLFFRKIEFIHWKFGSIGMLFCCIFLAIFYPLNSHYYARIKIESLFTINWYNSNNSNKWMDILLCFISIGFQLVLLNMSIKLLTEINKLKQNELKAAESIQKQSSNVEYFDDEPVKGFKKCKAIILFIIHLIIYICGCIYICNYFIILSLPKDNIFDINPNVSSFMAYSMALYLMLFNKYSIRHLVDSFLTIMNWKQYYEFYQSCIIILHCINCVIIPFIAGIILLQDCGRNWIRFWDVCINNELKQIFDVSIETDYDTFNIGMSSNDICESISFLNINWNKCIRSWLYHWSFIIIYKVIYGSVGSVLGLIWRCCKFKFFPMFKRNRKFRLNIARYNIKIMTNLIISITFSFCSPLIIPIYLLGIISIKYLHKYMMIKYDLQLYALTNEENIYYLPIHLIIFGIIINQMFVLAFLFLCLQSIFPACMLLASLCIMDFAVVKNIYATRKSNVSTTSIRLLEIQENESKNKSKPIKRKLSAIDEQKETQYEQKHHDDAEIVYDDSNINTNTETHQKNSLSQMEMANMQNYDSWMKEMKSKVTSHNNTSSTSVINYGERISNVRKSAADRSNLSLVNNDSMVNTMNYDKYIQKETQNDYNIHKQHQSVSETQHYTIELSANQTNVSSPATQSPDVSAYESTKL